MTDSEINLTYETLFELSRREKNRAELQRLEKSFFSDFINYLKQKKDISEKQGGFDFSSQVEKQKIDQQLYNIKKLMKEIFDKREKKITDMAVITARTGSKIIDVNLTDSEKQFFSELTALLSEYRNSILLPLLEGNLPETKDLKSNLFDTDIGKKTEKSEFKDQKTNKKAENALKIEFLDDVPEFVGLDLEDYGPFHKNDVVELPKQIAFVLIENKVAKTTSN